MTSNGPTPASGGAKLRLAALSAVLIPAGRGLPPAPVAGVPGAMLDRIAALRPEVGTILAAAVDFRPELPPDAAVLAMAQDDPALHTALFEVLAAAYYLAPAVRAGTGYLGQKALALPRGGFGAEDLTLEIMARPPSFRVPPDFVMPDAKPAAKD